MIYELILNTRKQTARAEMNAVDSSGLPWPPHRRAENRQRKVARKASSSFLIELPEPLSGIEHISAFVAWRFHLCFHQFDLTFLHL